MGWVSEWVVYFGLRTTSVGVLLLYKSQVHRIIRYA